MAKQEDIFKKIVSHAKEYGFVFQSSEIYDGLAAVYDYGQMGVELKNNIKRYWWEAMTLLHENIVGIDSAIFMHPTIWKASGHVDAFNDPLIDNRDSKKRYRADVLIEDEIAKFDDKIEKEVAKAAKKFGDSFDAQLYRSTNPRVLQHQKERDELHERYQRAMNANDLAELKQIILDYGIVCPISGTKNWTDYLLHRETYSKILAAANRGYSADYEKGTTVEQWQIQRAKDSYYKMWGNYKYPYFEKKYSNEPYNVACEDLYKTYGIVPMRLEDYRRMMDEKSGKKQEKINSDPNWQPFSMKGNTYADEDYDEEEEEISNKKNYDKDISNTAVNGMTNEEMMRFVCDGNF